jgi:imidazolonepropionase-like amidohydrolase
MAVAMTARKPSEIMAALEVIEEFGLKAVLLDARDADEAVPAIKAAGVGVILAPLRASSRRKELALPATLERERIPFAFCSDAPTESGPDALRISAALAVRNGLPKEAAFTALTARPAVLLGVEARVGTLRPGRDADFVVWSGHPVDLSSRILAVCVNGKEVFRRKESES